MQPVKWVRAVEVPKGLDEVWSCERHADELIGARRLTMTVVLSDSDEASVHPGPCVGPQIDYRH